MKKINSQKKLAAIGHTRRLRMGTYQKVALSQIFLLVIGIVAITYAIGSEVELVRGLENDALSSYSLPDDSRDYRYNNDRWEVLSGGDS